ncbi:hypothetical protein TorRG33x02_146900, partial [Trema orientale]
LLQVNNPSFNNRERNVNVVLTDMCNVIIMTHISPNQQMQCRIIFHTMYS